MKPILIFLEVLLPLHFIAQFLKPVLLLLLHSKLVGGCKLLVDYFLLSTSGFSEACQMKLLFHDAFSYSTPILSFLFCVCICHSRSIALLVIHILLIVYASHLQTVTHSALCGLWTNTLAKYEVDRMDSSGGMWRTFRHFCLADILLP